METIDVISKTINGTRVNFMNNRGYVAQVVKGYKTYCFFINDWYLSGVNDDGLATLTEVGDRELKKQLDGLWNAVTPSRTEKG